MNYEFSYDGASRPKWEKVFTATSGEVFRSTLYFQNIEDRDNLSKEQVETYMGMLMSYAKDLASKWEVLSLEDDLTQNPYPLTGDYLEFKWALGELRHWFEWAYFNDKFDISHEPVEEEPE